MRTWPIALGMGLLLAAWSWHWSGQVAPSIADWQNVWFDADLGTVYEDMTNPGAMHRRKGPAT